MMWHKMTTAVVMYIEANDSITGLIAVSEPFLQSTYTARCVFKDECINK